MRYLIPTHTMVLYKIGIIGGFIGATIGVSISTSLICKCEKKCPCPVPPLPASGPACPLPPRYK